MNKFTQTNMQRAQSTQFFHAPAERSLLKISAESHLMKLISNRPLLQRDQDILLALDDVGMLTRHQIQQLFFTSRSRATKRLKILYDKHLLNASGDFWFQFIKKDIDLASPIEGLDKDNCAQTGLIKSFIYTPALAGRHFISLAKNCPVQGINFDPSRYNPAIYNHLMIHDLWISEAYVKFRLALEEVGLPFAWKNEKRSIIHYRDDPEKEVVRPDATFSTAFSIQPNGEPFPSAKFIEMDRGSTDWKRKVSMYNLAFEEGDWRRAYTDFPFVLCVVPDRLYNKAIQGIKPNLDAVEFCVTSWSEFLNDPISWFSINSEKQISILPRHYRDE